MSEHGEETKKTRAEENKALWQARFLKELSESGNVLWACQSAKVNRSYAYRCRDDEPDFAAAWASAVEDAGDVLEHEAYRRAVKGVMKPIFHQGEECGRVREYSDGLLTLLLKAAKKEKYQDRVHAQHSGPGGGPIQHHVSGQVDIALLTDDELRTLDETFDVALARASQNGAGKT